LPKLSKGHRSYSDILGEIVIVIIIPKVIVDAPTKKGGNNINVPDVGKLVDMQKFG